tara:strand:+ start:256 stop:1527 length:1272 start_codon:yes stop_codon:yes gene_type:complete
MARTGIGAAYVQRQMAAGRSLASINQEAAAKGYEIGPKAAAMFAGGGGGGGGGGGAPAPAPAPAAAQSSGQRTGIGATYVQQQLDAGKSLGQIQAEAKSKGYTVGAKAQSMFDNAAKQSTDYSGNYGLPPTGRFFDPTNFSGAEDQMGSGGFGLSALNRARAAGYTDGQIRTTLAGAGVEIGGKAADSLNVAAGKTFYTGADGKKRPDHVASNYTGQAGKRPTRPFLLPKGAYDHSQGKPFEQNYLFAAGGSNDAELANLYLRGDWKAAVPGEYGAYSEPDWNKYVGENGFFSARPDLTGHMGEDGKALPSPELAPKKEEIKPIEKEPEVQYKETFNKAVEEGGGTTTDAPVGSMKEVVNEVKTVVDVDKDKDEMLSTESSIAESDKTSTVTPIKSTYNTAAHRSRGYLTQGNPRAYYSSRFK